MVKGDTYIACAPYYVSCSCCCFFLCFFFQAEDGIRDHCVTGVQTCALPISSWPLYMHKHVQVAQGVIHRMPYLQVDVVERSGIGDIHLKFPGICPVPKAIISRHVLVRSEERRVGKECRARWSPYQ